MTTAADLTIIAHCGACTHFADNSLEALEPAVEEGADMIELDLRRTADGHVVIIHDATTYRMMGAGGTLSEMTLAEVRALRGPQGERIATLAEALALPRPIIHEFKQRGIEAELAATRRILARDKSAPAWRRFRLMAHTLEWELDRQRRRHAVPEPRKEVYFIAGEEPPP